MPRPRPMIALLKLALSAIDWSNRRLGRAPERTAAQQLGMDGERAAYFFLRQVGFTVVARRWRHALLKGEVDLIAWDGETLVFVEVKTRESRTAFAAEFRIDDGKKDALQRMAEAYVRQLPWRTGESPDLRVRFDVVSVYLQQGGQTDIRLLRDFMR